MRWNWTPSFVLALALSCGTVAHAQERGSADEAQAMLAEAVAHYDAAGRDQALADFNDAEGAFRDRDLYVFCFGADDTMVAHPREDLIGADITGLMDADGQNIGQGILDIGRGEGSGTLDYRWANPTTDEIEDKSSFIQAVGDDICAVGYYK